MIKLIKIMAMVAGTIAIMTLTFTRADPFDISPPSSGPKTVEEKETGKEKKKVDKEKKKKKKKKNSKKKSKRKRNRESQ